MLKADVETIKDHLDKLRQFNRLLRTGDSVDLNAKSNVTLGTAEHVMDMVRGDLNDRTVLTVLEYLRTDLLTDIPPMYHWKAATGVPGGQSSGPDRWGLEVAPRPGTIYLELQPKGVQVPGCCDNGFGLPTVVGARGRNEKRYGDHTKFEYCPVDGQVVWNAEERR